MEILVCLAVGVASWKVGWLTWKKVFLMLMILGSPMMTTSCWRVSWGNACEFVSDLLKFWQATFIKPRVLSLRGLRMVFGGGGGGVCAAVEVGVVVVDVVIAFSFSFLFPYFSSFHSRSSLPGERCTSPCVVLDFL